MLRLQRDEPDVGGISFVAGARVRDLPKLNTGHFMPP
jgi:hypothetical protein